MRYPGLDRERRQEAGYLLPSHLGRMTLVVEVDEATDPADIGFLRASARVLSADGLAHAFKELGLPGIRTSGFLCGEDPSGSQFGRGQEGAEGPSREWASWCRVRRGIGKMRAPVRRAPEEWRCRLTQSRSPSSEADRALASSVPSLQMMDGLPRAARTGAPPGPVSWPWCISVRPAAGH